MNFPQSHEIVKNFICRKFFSCWKFFIRIIFYMWKFSLELSCGAFNQIFPSRVKKKIKINFFLLVFFFVGISTIKYVPLFSNKKFKVHKNCSSIYHSGKHFFYFTCFHTILNKHWTLKAFIFHYQAIFTSTLPESIINTMCNFTRYFCWIFHGFKSFTR